MLEINNSYCILRKYTITLNIYIVFKLPFIQVLIYYMYIIYITIIDLMMICYFTILLYYIINVFKILLVWLCFYNLLSIGIIL